jgi:hypothetical protein
MLAIDMLAIELPDKSSVAEHSINLERRIHLRNTSIVFTKPIYTERGD